jgi:hypothetical protein
LRREKSFLTVYALIMAYWEAKASSGTAKNVRITQELVGGGIQSNTAGDKSDFVCDVERGLSILPPHRVKILLCRYCPNDVQKSFERIAMDFRDSDDKSAPFFLRYKGRVHDELGRSDHDAKLVFSGMGYIKQR